MSQIHLPTRLQPKGRVSSVQHTVSDPRLTVAHFLPSAVMGGAETATLRMTEATNGRLRNVAFCLADALELRRLFETQGVETVTYNPPIPSLRHGVRYYKESLTLARQIRQVGADIVHFADKFAAQYSSLAAFLAGARIVCHIRLSHPKLTLRDRLSLLPVNNFVFVSQDAKRTFGLRVAEKNSWVIYDWIELPDQNQEENRRSARQEFGIPSDCFVVGMVARVAPQKDFFTLATAAADVLREHPNTRFLVAGENSRVASHRLHYEEVVKRLVELDVFDKFIFTGHRADVRRLIAGMDLCVLCTHREGFGLAIAEGMAMRKPVIATGVGGVLEVIEHDVTGYLHRHGDSKQLAEQINYLIDNPREAGRLAMEGYEHVRRDYSRGAFLAGITKTYCDIMGEAEAGIDCVAC